MSALKFRRYWPLATRKQAATQAVRLAKAKRYMAEKGIEAVKVGSQFQYAARTGSVL